MKKILKYASRLRVWYFSWSTFVVLLFISCESYLDIKPPSTSINSLNVFENDKTSIAAVTGLYEYLVGGASGISATSITLNGGLSADELTLFDGSTNNGFIAKYRNQLQASATSTYGGESWTRLFALIMQTNASLDGLSATTTLTTNVKQQLMGECYFLRAFSFFYLTNLYGDVPLPLTADPNINNGLPRVPSAKVYEQVTTDLIKAIELLKADYLNQLLAPYAANAERVRPNKAAARALLARAYLYTGKYGEAELLASLLIDDRANYVLLPLNQVFLKNSKEAIWQLQPTEANRNTNDGFMFILPANGPDGANSPVYLSETLLQSFEPADQRAILGNWVNRRTTPTGLVYDYPFKYKSNVAEVTEYDMVFRLGEQYLIRAESRAHQDKLTGPNSAASDMNIIRERAGLPPTTATTQTELLDAILQERRVELFTEWGHRWLDLKRTGKVDDVMRVATGEKGGTWESYQQWYPLPFNDIQYGPNLRQNQGY